MALTKISGDVIQSGINIGIVTATRIDGDINGNVNSSGVSTFSTLKVGTSVNISSGIVTATSFVGNVTGNATGLSGTPNIVVGTIGATSLNASGVVTATTFSGNLTGNVTGNATGLSGTPNINVGAITASSATITGSVSVAGTVTYEDTTNVDSIGIITARSGIIVNSGGATISGVTTVSAGSTVAPSISPSGDSNTGIFFPAPDTVAIAEGGVEALRVDSSGRVGIGTNNASNDIDVYKSSTTTIRLKSTSGGTNILLDSSTTPSVSNQISFALDGSQKWAIGGANVGSAGSTKFSLYNYAASNNSFTVDSNNNFLIGTVNATGTASQPLQVTGGAYVSGNLGIGTQSPSEKLDVGGSISAAGRNLNVPHIIVKDSIGGVTYFEYYFNLVKTTNAGTATQLNILSVGNLSNFHQAAFTVEYGTRIQGVSDATASACLKQFGVNKFNSGNVAITDTNDIASDTNSNTHANITCVTNGASAYIIRGEFSSTAAGSSFISGVLRGWGLADKFNSGGVATLTFSNGPT